jgi:hypothetical protein
MELLPVLGLKRSIDILEIHKHFLDTVVCCVPRLGKSAAERARKLEQMKSNKRMPDHPDPLDIIG